MRENTVSAQASMSNVFAYSSPDFWKAPSCTSTYPIHYNYILLTLVTFGYKLFRNK